MGSLEDERLTLPDTGKAGLTSLIAELMTREPPVTGSTLDEVIIKVTLNIEISQCRGPLHHQPVFEHHLMSM